jgi:hypothetical protein
VVEERYNSFEQKKSRKKMEIKFSAISGKKIKFNEILVKNK